VRRVNRVYGILLGNSPPEGPCQFMAALAQTLFAK
jgi:hypothetical protein